MKLLRKTCSTYKMGTKERKLIENLPYHSLLLSVLPLCVYRLGFSMAWFLLGAEGREKLLWKQTLSRMVMLRLHMRVAAEEPGVRGTKLPSKWVTATSWVSWAISDSHSRHPTSMNQRHNGQLWGKAAVVQALFQVFLCLLTNLPNVPRG